MPAEQLITQHLDLWTTAIRRKSSAGRGSSQKVELYGIRKLRELILELAVRGLLVPQDPNDEPASELLKQIVAEKEKLSKHGKIKKERPQPPISEQEEPFGIPVGWTFVRFGDLLINRDSERIPLSVDERETRRGDYDYYGASGVIDSIDAYLFDKPLLLIGEDGANLINRSTPIAFMAHGKYWVNNHAHVLDGFSEDLLLYVCLYINAISLEPYVTGTAQPKMNQAKMNGIVVALPPLAEQQRIVAKVDELMALCDRLEQQTDASLSAHQTLVETLLNALIGTADHAQFASSWQRITEHFDTLFTTEESIDQLKQAILQLAVMGKLVPQDPNDEPASDLLKVMAGDKARLIKERAIRNARPLAPISNDEKFMPLPAGWAFARLNDVGDWGAGATPIRNDPRLYGGSIPWFKSGELTADYISQSEETVTELALEKCSLRYNKVGDVLIAMYGATIGKTSILSVPATTNQAVCACTPFRGFANTYLLTLLKAYKARFVGMGAGGAQPNISREKIIETVVAVPPSSEQHRIVAKVEELMTLCDKLKSHLSEAQTTQLHLADAIAEMAVARA